MQENYLEESVVMCDDARSRGKSKYIMASVVSWTSCVFGVISIFMFMMSGFTSLASLLMLIPAALGIFLFIFFRLRKDRYLFDCDYIFVDGSIRIAKVLNGRKRKALTVLECTDIESIGQYTSEKYNNYAHMPDIKKIVATPNVDYHDEKIFYCFYPHNGQRTLLLFEPSNLFLLTVSKAAKKNVFNV